MKKQPDVTPNPTQNLRVLNQSFIDAATAYKHEVWMKAAKRLDEINQITLDPNADDRRTIILRLEYEGLSKILKANEP